MKKVLITMVALVCLLMTTVSALDIDVECGRDKWYDPFGSMCRDYELDDEFNQVEEAIEETDEYISTHESSWLQDLIGGGGWRQQNVVNYLYGTFLNFLDDRYLDRIEKCEDYNYDNQARIFKLQRRIYELEKMED